MGKAAPQTEYDQKKLNSLNNFAGAVKTYNLTRVYFPFELVAAVI